MPETKKETTEEKKKRIDAEIEKLKKLKDAEIEELEKRKNDKIEKLKKQKQVILSRESKEARKQRTRELIQLGGLIEVAGLTRQIDKGVLVGALLLMKDIIDNPEKSETVNTFKINGDAAIAKREAEKNNK